MDERKKTTVAYEIIANKFAPKRSDKTSDMYTNSHSICFGKCNCDCIFCDFKKRPCSAYQVYSLESFSKIIDELLLKGKNFKFTGGEPTLNLELEKHLEIVKSKGGYIYLDSNGSNPKYLERLIKKDLINVLGISLKGITIEEATQVSQVKKSELIWENVWKTLDISSKYSDNIRTIVTLVFTIENRENRLATFAKLLEKYPNVYMKVNNLQRDDHPEHLNIHSINPDSLYKEIESFVKENPIWENRVIYVPSSDGVSNYNSIMFF